MIKNSHQLIRRNNNDFLKRKMLYEHYLVPKITDMVMKDLNEGVVDNVKDFSSKLKMKISKVVNKIKSSFSPNIDKAAKKVENIESNKQTTLKKYFSALRNMPQILDDDWEDNLTDEKKLQLKIMIVAMILLFGGGEIIEKFIK